MLLCSKDWLIVVPQMISTFDNIRTIIEQMNELFLQHGKTNRAILNIGMNVPNPVEFDKKTYIVTCDGNCENVTTLMEFSGDDTANADILANEDCPPAVSGNLCPTCSMCEGISTEGNVEVCCNKETVNGNRSVQHYYVTAYSIRYPYLLPSQFFSYCGG